MSALRRRSASRQLTHGDAFLAAFHSTGLPWLEPHCTHHGHMADEPMTARLLIVGALLSLLNADEAQRFATLAVAFTEGRIAMHINNNGDIELTSSI